MSFDYDMQYEQMQYVPTMWRANNGTWHTKGDPRGRRCKSGIEFRPTFKNDNEKISLSRDVEEGDLVRRNKSALMALICAHPDRAREIYRRKIHGDDYE